jgi:hypothetical protein
VWEAPPKATSRDFVVGFIFDIETHVPFGAVMQDFDFSFLDESGNDVSEAFELSNR